MSKVGFIGLGNMGAPMAANLAKAGHEVTGFDLAAVTVEGVAMAASAKAAVTGRDAVITMLPDGPILRSVYQEIVPATAPGSCMIDCSTVDVDSARAGHGMAADASLLSVDAPVSGGVGGAIAGTLDLHGWRHRGRVRQGVAAVRGHGQKGGTLWCGRGRDRRPRSATT